MEPRPRSAPTIRPWSSEEDLVAIASLVRLANEELGRPDVDGEARATVAILTRSSQGIGLIAEADGDIIGSVIAERERTEAELHIRWLVVRTGSRRLGVATALVDTLEAMPGVRRVTGTVDQQDPIAHGFWTKRGWTTCRPRPGRRRELMGVDVTQMPRPTISPAH